MSEVAAAPLKRSRPASAGAISVGVRVLAGIAALLLAALPLLATGAPIIEAYGLMVTGALGSAFAVSETLTRATPLILTGLAAAVAFRAKLWNIGAEGQLYAGAIATVVVGTGLIEAPAFITLPAVVLAGAAAGAFLMLIPTLLKVRLGVDEVVTTLLLNFVVLLFVQMLLDGALKDPMGMGWPQSPPVVPAAELPEIWPRTRLHAGLILGIVAALVLSFVIARTTFGFRMRAVGENAAAARFAGISVAKTMIGVGLISGALAGLAGVGEVAGLKGYLTSDISPGFGYAGIVVAMLAGLSPIGSVVSALFIAAIYVGADSMSRALGVSSYLADLIVAMALISILIGEVVARRLTRGAR
ncbi:MAG: ABC transporter permease [Pseudomonadota bacterium]